MKFQSIFQAKSYPIESGPRILRRHTTYVKSTSNVNEAAEKESAVSKLLRGPHVHSWHRNRNKNKREQQQQNNGKKRMSMLWNSKVRSLLQSMGLGCF